MADTDNTPNNSQQPNKNPFSKKEYDILDPEATAKSNEKKSLNDRVNDLKHKVEKGKKFIIALPVPILIVIILVGVVGYFTSIPGLMMGKIKEFAANAIDDIQSLFLTEADSYVNAEDVVNLANYLEEMEYDLIGYGFVEPDLDTMDDISSVYPSYTELYEQGYIYYETKTENGDTSPRYYNEEGEAYDGYYYNSLGLLVDNSDGEIATIEDEVYIDKYGILRSSTEYATSGEGIIEDLSNVDTTLLRTYLLSDYRIYALRNNEGILNALYSNIKSIFGGYDSAWSKGLIKLYESENGLATNAYSANIIDSILGTSWFDNITIDSSTNEMIIKTGFGNNTMSYSIDGWTDRYGMSLEFLLSLHLATMAPDLVYAMLQSFDTEIQVYLNDSGSASVESAYVDLFDDDVVMGEDQITFSDVNEALVEGGFWYESLMINDSDSILEQLNELGLTRKAAQYLLTDEDLNLTSPDNCSGIPNYQVILVGTEDYQIASSSNLLSGTYGIDESSAEVYDFFDEYNDNTTFYNEDMKEYLLSIENCELSLEGDKEDFDAYDYSYFTDDDSGVDLLLYGYTGNEGDETNLQITYKYDSQSAYEESDYIDGGEDTSKATLDRGVITTTRNYYAKEQIIERTWSALAKDQNGNEIEETEEVEYTWITYKYLIYYDSTSYNESDQTYEGNSSGVYCDTIIFEFIIRDKTTAELLEDGRITYDANTGEYVDADYNSFKCSSNYNQLKCCENCFEYVKSVIQALADVSDTTYQTSTPYIARVLGSWFRDTYFVIPEEIYEATYEVNARADDYIETGNNGGDYAIYDYLNNEGNRTSTEVAMIENAYGTNSTVVIVDEEYLAETGEYWTSYITDENGDYVLFYMNPDGTYMENESNDYGYVTMDEFLETNGYSSQEEAEEDGYVFVKKAVTKSATEITSDTQIEGVVWSAYGFSDEGSSTGWIQIGLEDETDNDYIEAVYSYVDESDYNENGGFYYRIEQTYTITQVEDALRSETNSTVKWLFKYRKYYIYDGTETTALAIAEDKELVFNWAKSYLLSKYNNSETTMTVAVANCLNLYGRSALRQAYSELLLSYDDSDVEDLVEQWLEWQLDVYYSGIIEEGAENYYVLDDIGFIEETDDDGNVIGLTVTTNLSEADRVGDPRDPNLINTVNIDKTSIDAFTILENTGTLAAEYAYRDFKELVVELDYFDKEDLSDAISSVFTWIIPDVSEIGWPIREYDKQDVDYGALIESAGTYEFLEEINYGEDTTTDTTEDEEESEEDEETEDSAESTSTFSGYEGGELVSSPVTGKVIEYGTHTRTNVYTGEEEEVGYIVIQALDSEIFTEDNISYYTDAQLTDEEDIAEALNLFYDEYEDTCDNYTVMIDGINIDTSITDETDMTAIKNALLNLTDEEGNYGSYEQNEVVALYNSKEQSNREANEQAKDDAPYLVIVDGDIYIKEGKYIGTTYTDDEATSYVIEDEEGNKTDPGPANYIRIIVKDSNYTVIDNVEDYFDIEEPINNSSSIYSILGSISSDADLDTKILYAMEYYISLGFTTEAAAGIVGNLVVESSLDPTATNSTAYYGIAQWDTSNRWGYVETWLIEEGYNTDDLVGQLEAVYYAEQESGTGMSDSNWDTLKRLTNVEQATELFCVYYERCAGSTGSGDGKTEYYNVGTTYQDLKLRKAQAVDALELYNSSN